MSTVYFAWVDPTDTTFSPTFARVDEHVFGFTRDHSEGGIPEASISIANPHVGLLNPGRKYWAWLSYLSDANVLVPLFFGRLVGIPTGLEDEVLTLKFIARPTNYTQAKQAVAETLKVLPFYDPVFYPLGDRDDPDKILEGYSALYHVDPVTLAVSVSDILYGEDGTVAFGAGTAFYDSVKVSLNQSPLTAVAVQASVTWNQEYNGFVPVISGSFGTYTGEPFIADFPRTGTALGGGWSVGVGWAANATAAIDLASIIGNYSYTFSFQNTQKTHNTGDLMTVSINGSFPSGMGALIGFQGNDQSLNTGGAPAAGGLTGYVFTYKNQTISGVLVPFAVDVDGNPDPVNTPGSVEKEGVIFAEWACVYCLSLNYFASRKRTERIAFTLQSNVQPTITDPLVTEDTETIKLTGQDVSLPIIPYFNWSSVAASPVALGTVIFPDNPTVPGQNSAQVCIGAGTTGATEPVFSNIGGATTADGSAEWASLGDSTPNDSFPDWSRSTPMPLGAILIPRPLQGVYDVNSLVDPGMLTFPRTLPVVSKYQIFSDGNAVPGGALQECTVPGLFQIDSTLISISNPTGKFSYICTTAGISGDFHTTWNEGAGLQTADGTVVWTCIGEVDLPVGGYPGMTGARSYFPSDRGLQSIEHLIVRARAKLRYRARAVQVSWECPFDSAIGLTCRMNASLADPRLPGGSASGKITKCQLSMDGSTGKVLGSVTVGCSVGFGGTISASPGSADYVVDDYITTAHFAQTGAQNVVGHEGDVGYTPPVEGVVDDGLIFPLTGMGNGILDSTVHANSGAELAAIQEACAQLMQQMKNGQSISFATVTGTATYSVTEPNWLAAAQAAYDAILPSGVWYSLSLPPLNVGPFAASYVLNTTLLELPQTINLEAASSV